MKKKPKIILMGSVGVTAALWSLASLLVFRDIDFSNLNIGSVSGSSDENTSPVPADIPLPEIYDVISASETSGGKQVNLKVSSSLKQTSQFYEESLQNLGWVLNNFTFDTVSKSMFFVKDGRELGVDITESTQEGFTVIGLSF